METIFLTPIEKSDIIESLKDGNSFSIDCVISEIDRLESIIKDYELGIYQINLKFNSTASKTPTKKFS